jgi:hypothetical protein
MKKEEITLNKIEAEDGYVFAKKDLSEVYGGVIYLAKSDDGSNYVEITIEEADEIIEEKNTVEDEQ